MGPAGDKVGWERGYERQYQYSKYYSSDDNFIPQNK